MACSICFSNSLYYAQNYYAAAYGEVIVSSTMLKYYWAAAQGGQLRKAKQTYKDVLFPLIWSKIYGTCQKILLAKQFAES